MAITLKEWNNLPQEKREKASYLIFFNFNEDIKKKMSEEWHHNLDVNHREMLKKLAKEGTDIVVKPVVKL